MKIWILTSYDGELVKSFHKNDANGKKEILEELNNLKDNISSFSELPLESLIERFSENFENGIGENVAEDNIFVDIELHYFFEEV